MFKTESFILPHHQTNDVNSFREFSPFSIKKKIDFVFIVKECVGVELRDRVREKERSLDQCVFE